MAKSRYLLLTLLIGLISYSFIDLFLKLPFEIPIASLSILGGLVFIAMAYIETKKMFNDTASNQAVVLMVYWVISFLGITVGFSGIYLELLRQNPVSFVGLSDGISALYFSLVTFATVGYGDIYPVSAIAKVLVMSEVLFSVILMPIVIAITIAFIINKKQLSQKNHKISLHQDEQTILKRIK
ncbi:potassium channel family protein [Syntrophomonas palmitatica]|uniref:potassium channel family protein n=1 Tax=Syntrophomonas palmitatica TaxID=402877 RepID=UPI0006D1BB18|nr:potassium channel family protein [Syntrophomonas palmitatica]